MLQRVISALAVQETDPEQPPFRRPTMAAIGGIVIGILSCVAVWVFGLVVPGGNKFTATDVIAVEEETGARFVLMDGQLHPVKNYVSALLALDKHAEVRTVSHATLAGIPAGVPIGIQDAPDSLPGKDQLLTGAWTVCSQSTTDDQNQTREDTVLLVGHTPDRSSAAAARGVLVHAGDRDYLLYRGYRHAVQRSLEVVLTMGATPIDVAGRWLDTIPNGDPILPMPVNNSGQPSTAVPGKGLLTGQVLQVDDGQGTGLDDDTEPQYYLVRPDQLQPISSLQAHVQQALDLRAANFVPVGNRELANAVITAPAKPEPDDIPRTAPAMAPIDNPEAAVCALFQPGETTPQVLTSASLSAADQGPADAPPPPADTVRVAVPAGKAALIEVVTGKDQQQGTIALVDDQGKMHALADPQHVQQVLGYDGVAPTRVTEVLTGQIPTATALSPAAARTPVTGS